MRAAVTGMGKASKFPETIEAAVRLLLALVPEPEQSRVATLTQPELINLHFGLGMWIRNNMGLWQGNQALVQACGVQHPDDASVVLIEAFWQHLRALKTKLH